MERCPGCRVALAALDGPAHRYIGASPACWAVYGRLMAGEPPLTPNRTAPLLVDAYAAQHPGEDSPQERQSAAVHLIVLHGAAHLELTAGDLVPLRVTAVEEGRRRGGYPRLLPAPDSWEITIHSIAEAADQGTRDRLAGAYPSTVLESWSGSHGETIAEWFRQAWR